MLIEFRIQLDGNGGVSVVNAQAAPDPNFPRSVQLRSAYVAPAHAALNPATKLRAGGTEPFGDIGTGLPKGTPMPSHPMQSNPMQASPGMTFVIGPIVINGSVPSQNYPAPNPASFEMPQADAQHAEPLMHDKPRAAKAAKRKAPARKR